MGEFFVLLSHILACLFEVFTGLWLSTPTFCIIMIIIIIIMIAITGCLKKFLKNGEHYIVDFQFNLCETPHECVLRRRFVFSVF